MNVITLKITWLNQFRQFWMNLAFLGVMLYFFFSSDGMPMTLLLILGAFVGFVVLFPLHVHIDYLTRNYGETYEIDDTKIIRRKNGLETVYNVTDITDIYLYRSSVNRIPWGMYHFAQIVMKSGENIYLTSLLYPSVWGIQKILENYLKVPFLREEVWLTTTPHD